MHGCTFYPHFIRIEFAGILKESEYLAIFGDTSLVGALFYPNASRQVLIRFISTTQNLRYKHFLAVKIYHFGPNKDGRTHMLIGGIAYFACSPLNVCIVKPYNATSLIFYSKQDDTTLAIGKCGHFFCRLLL